MKVVSGREFARIVERRGWRLLRVTGSGVGRNKRKSALRRSFAARPAISSIGAITIISEAHCAVPPPHRLSFVTWRNALR
jgi:hypothetical protein